MKLFYLCTSETKAEILETEERPNVGGIHQWNSISGGYSSKEELAHELKLAPEPCSCCGKVYGTNYCKPYNTMLITKKLCFNCNFWDEYTHKKDDPKIARIQGHHYVVEPPSPLPSRMLGFSGREFKVRWHDGREVTTNNLWSQGDIPERFKDRLPDNAEFVK
jgi:hypothetical protein